MGEQREDVERGHSSITGWALFIFPFRDKLFFFFSKKNQNLLIASHLMEVSM